MLGYHIWQGSGWMSIYYFLIREFCVPNMISLNFVHLDIIFNELSICILLHIGLQFVNIFRITCNLLVYQMDSDISFIFCSRLLYQDVLFQFKIFNIIKLHPIQ